MTGPVISVAAVDLGASSGRVMLGRVGADTLSLTEVERFLNEPVRADGTLYWDILNIYRGVLDGLHRAGPIASIGVDSWAVDYGLLDADGRLLGNPVHYRDTRTDGVMDKVLAQVSAAEMYDITGLQFLPFNTAFQLVAARASAQFRAARTLLLIPDLVTYWLTGEVGAERTNASTTALLDTRTGRWSGELMTRLGLDPGLFPPVREPGTVVGPLRAEVATQIGVDRGGVVRGGVVRGGVDPGGVVLGEVAAADIGRGCGDGIGGGVGGGSQIQVIAVGSHDTASAVAAVPATTSRFAYISCGTWSLVGLELDDPVLTEASRAANFTNEIGIDGTVRYLRNVMGLWPLQECLRVWRAAGYEVDLPALLKAAANVTPFASLVNLDQPLFLPPGDMPARIVAECRQLGQRSPDSPAETVRCILDSLALAHRLALRDAQRLSGREVDVVHIVGGGARNALLCQLTADACGLPVVAGPEEATAIGNVLVQALALGVVEPSLARLRDLVGRTQRVRHFAPTENAHAWAEAARRVRPR